MSNVQEFFCFFSFSFCHSPKNRGSFLVVQFPLQHLATRATSKAYSSGFEALSPSSHLHTDKHPINLNKRALHAFRLVPWPKLHISSHPSKHRIVSSDLHNTSFSEDSHTTPGYLSPAPIKPGYRPEQPQRNALETALAPEQAQQANR